MNYRVRKHSLREGMEGSHTDRYQMVGEVFTDKIAAFQSAFDRLVKDIELACNAGCYVRSNGILSSPKGVKGFHATIAYEETEPGDCVDYSVIEVDYDFVIGEDAQ